MTPRRSPGYVVVVLERDRADAHRLALLDLVDQIDVAVGVRGAQPGVMETSR
jgi:hypothetical protein